jgi:hypothetical protein
VRHGGATLVFTSPRAQLVFTSPRAQLVFTSPRAQLVFTSPRAQLVFTSPRAQLAFTSPRAAGRGRRACAAGEGLPPSKRITLSRIRIARLRWISWEGGSPSPGPQTGRPLPATRGEVKT